MRYRVKKGRKTIGINDLETDSVKCPIELREGFLERLKQTKKRKKTRKK